MPPKKTPGADGTNITNTALRQILDSLAAVTSTLGQLKTSFDKQEKENKDAIAEVIRENTKNF
jgi:hypothetical protein